MKGVAESNSYIVKTKLFLTLNSHVISINYLERV